MTDRTTLILLVEDDPAHAEIVRRNLGASRYVTRLEHVSDGQEALNYLFRKEKFSDPEASPRPDLILLDMRLPLVDGLEVLKTIKSNGDLSHIPVVMLTSSASRVDMESAYAFQANSYLVKPSDCAQFSELIEALGYYWVRWNQI